MIISSVCILNVVFCRETVPLGFTDFSESDVDGLIEMLGNSFAGSSYHLIERYEGKRNTSHEINTILIDYPTSFGQGRHQGELLFECLSLLYIYNENNYNGFVLAHLSIHL